MKVHPIFTEDFIECPECEGQGGTRAEEIVGYVTHDMALDACEPSMEGMPIYDWVDYECERCGGTGKIEQSDLARIDKDGGE